MKKILVWVMTVCLVLVVSACNSGGSMGDKSMSDKSMTDNKMEVKK